MTAAQFPDPTNPPDFAAESARLLSMRDDPHGKPVEATVTIHGVELTLHCRNFYGDDLAAMRAFGELCAEAIRYGSAEFLRDWEKLREHGSNAATKATMKWPCWSTDYTGPIPEVEAVPTAGYQPMRYARTHGGGGR